MFLWVWKPLFTHAIVILYEQKKNYLHTNFFFLDPKDKFF